MFSKVKLVVRMCGDYVAFCETDVYIEYIFGDYFYVGDLIEEYLMKELNLDWEIEGILEKQDKSVLDSLVKEYIINIERDYCDFQISDGVVELDDNGKVLGTYWSC